MTATTATEATTFLGFDHINKLHVAYIAACGLVSRLRVYRMTQPRLAAYFDLPREEARRMSLYGEIDAQLWALDRMGYPTLAALHRKDIMADADLVQQIQAVQAAEHMEAS